MPPSPRKRPAPEKPNRALSAPDPALAPSRPAPPPPPTSGWQSAPGAPLEIITGASQGVSDRIVLTAIQGWGKTTMAANSPQPLILMAQGETGYETLLAHNLVPEVPRARVASWPQLLSTLDILIALKDFPYKTIVFDALGGFERLCHQEVCERDLDGDWGEKGFTGFQRGYKMASNDWIQFLQRLDTLRDTHSPDILILSHCKVETFKNPLGTDYDRYISNVNKVTWDLTNEWVDVVLFCNFYSVVDARGKRPTKGKGIGGKTRVIYTEHRDAYDAKNRHNLPEEIQIPNDRDQAWATLAHHLKGSAE